VRARIDSNSLQEGDTASEKERQLQVCIVYGFLFFYLNFKIKFIKYITLCYIFIYNPADCVIYKYITQCIYIYGVIYLYITRYIYIYILL
jgi:hypothetical protein